MLEVRHVRASDVAGVLALITTVLGEFGLEFGNGSTTDDELRALPEAYADRGGAFWVALRDGELLGTCGVFPLAAGTYELRKMYLLPAARGLGLGKRMLDDAITWVRDQRGTRIVLDTVEEMTRAIAFYEAHGFVRDDCQVRGSRCTRGYSRTL
jgi:putative acetyltransferase